ncbi:sensor histidine kinase [Pedomonas sp. V897]|uniref:sensor histidine kinase n=1 Tax=Pedomonas sp. V897 TaxID=3446482 RepID=UPI003EE062A3
MKRFLPQSLAGQMALLIGGALLIAQLFNFGLILNERQKLGLARNEGPAITRFAGTVADYVQAAPEFRRLVLEDASRRGARFTVDPLPRVGPEAERRASAEERLRRELTAVEVPVADVRAAVRRIARRGSGPGPEFQIEVLFLSARLEDGAWLNARVFLPPRDPLLTVRLVLATVVLYLIVLGAALFIARRLSRPLQDLTRAAEQFGGRTAPAPVAPRGPQDLRRAIEAFNAMNHRVLALLDEKDRMLGAIGHDLRTPLASMRIRLESMEPEEDRARMIASIEEMTAMLEDILVLARSGRAREQARDMDVTALCDALCEDYAELGHDVALLDSARVVAPVQATLLRRAVRNLIDNALKYAGAAQVQVRRAGGAVEIAVLDSGPGLPPDELDRVLEPFYRVEASRNRETGGSGLGLAIAKAIAESHGGSLHLANRAEGGLAATLRLPADR